MAKIAKNESTAINDLINLVSTATPRKLAPDEDLMFSEPAKRSTKAIGAPRITDTLSGAGEVEPLPRGRGAAGTQQNSVTPAVRLTTAPPSRQTTIPPIAPPIPPIPAIPAIPAIPPMASRLATSSAALTPPLRTTSSPAITPPERSRPSLPPPTRSSAPAHLAPTHLAPTHLAPAMGIPVVAPIDLTDQSWFEESRRVDRVTGPRPHAHVEELFGTAEVPRGMTTAQWLGKLALPMGAMIVVGVFVGGYLAFDGEGGHKRSPQVAAPVVASTMPVAAAAPSTAPIAAPVAASTAPVAAVEPSTAPVAAEPARAQVAVAAPVTEPAIAAPAGAAPIVVGGRPVFVEVRLDSNPAGATVMLVDRGKTTFLGTTPISTAVDGARQYDLVFTYKDRPTHLEHLDPRTTSKLSVKLERTSRPTTEVATPSKAAPVKAAAVKAAPMKAAPAKLETTEPPATEVAKPKAEKAVVKPEVKTAAPAPAKAATGGAGVLMISSKPPCEILIDGKATGLMTPQRSLPLPAGAHKVTLVNTAEKIKKTLSIQITADQPTKVIQDLMNK